MGRSLRFRVYVQQLVALLRLAFASAPCLPLNLATARNSLVHSSIGTPSLSLRLLVDIRFQVLFHSPPGVLFTFPSRYCSTIGHQVVFRLGGWAPRIPIGFHVSDGTLDTTRPPRSFTYETLTLFRWLFHAIRLDLKVPHRSPNPNSISTVVWPLPLSLATTRGISFDFSSSGYLDVSVPRVPFLSDNYP